MNSKTRNYYLPQINEETGELLEDLNTNLDKKEMYGKLKNLVAYQYGSIYEDFIKKISPCIKCHTGQETEWRNLETADKKYMVISLHDNTSVRPIEDLLAKFIGAKIKYTFMILDGLAYQSGDKNSTLVYLEV